MLDNQKDPRLFSIKFKIHIQRVVDEFSCQLKTEPSTDSPLQSIQNTLNTTQTSTDLWDAISAKVKKMSQTGSLFHQHREFYTALKNALSEYPKEQIMACDIELLKRYNDLWSCNYQKLQYEHQSLQISLNNLQRSVEKFSSLEEINSLQKLDLDRQRYKTQNAVLQKENDLLSAKLGELDSINKKQVATIKELEDTYEDFQQKITDKFNIVEKKQMQQTEEIITLNKTLKKRDLLIQELKKQLTTPNLSRNPVIHFKAATEQDSSKIPLKYHSTQESEASNVS